MECKNEGQEEDLDLPLFGLPTISAATDNFSESNKLGEGGFGPVYRVSFSSSLKQSLSLFSNLGTQNNLTSNFFNFVVLLYPKV